MIEDRYLLVRAASVYLAVVALMLAIAWRRPDAPTRVGALMTLAWNVPALLILHLAAQAIGWWRFDFAGGGLLGFPVDLWLAWAAFWGPAIMIAAPRAPMWAIASIALAADLVLMPAASPVVRLETNWLVGETAAIALCLVPAQLLGRWTAAGQHLVARASMQVAAFAVLLLVILPAIALNISESTLAIPDLPRWQLSLAVQLLCVPILLGLTAVQEFVTRGGGTPVPFDPPQRLVTTGIYAYVKNPMQLSGVLSLLLLAAIVRNGYIALAALMSHIYSVGLAGWDEDFDLRSRFGQAWLDYSATVRRWIPRWRPNHGSAEPSRLFVRSDCDQCQEVAAWFTARGATNLSIVPADTFPRPLKRITYQSGDGHYITSGVPAIARALEHINLGWATIGFALRLPILSALIQLIVDASGGANPTPMVKPPSNLREPSS